MANRGIHNNMRYIFVDEFKNFNDHQALARELGGNLASIHNDDENEFVKGLVNTGGHGAFIGGIRKSGATNDTDKTADTWEWTDSSTFDYKSWREDQPDNHGSDDENVIEVTYGNEWDGKWNDRRGTDEFPAIYKLPLSAEITENNIRYVPNRFSFMTQVVRIYTNTMPPN